MTPPDYATWLTKQQAADAIGVSTKTLEQLAKDRKVEQGRWRLNGRGNAFAVYNPDDVARIASERRPAPAPFVLPAGSNDSGRGSAIARTAPDVEAQQALAGLSAFAAALRSLALNPEHPQKNPENFQKILLTVEEAAALSGETARDLRRAVRTGELPCRHKERRDWRTWRIRRKDLEQL